MITFEITYNGIPRVRADALMLAAILADALKAQGNNVHITVDDNTRKINGTAK